MLYILAEIGAKPNIGEAVICKMMYFIDFDYYELYEEKLMGVTYIKNKYGPTPKELVVIIETMKKDGELIKVATKHFQYKQTKYIPLRKANLYCLTVKEIKVIDDVISKYKDKSAKQMESISHQDIPWKYTEKFKEKIPYEAVFYRTPQFSVRCYN